MYDLATMKNFPNNSKRISTKLCTTPESWLVSISFLLAVYCVTICIIQRNGSLKYLKYATKINSAFAILSISLIGIIFKKLSMKVCDVLFNIVALMMLTTGFFFFLIALIIPLNERDKFLFSLTNMLNTTEIEKSFGDNCQIYDADNENGPWNNIKDKIDIFVPYHYFGWILKMLSIRSIFVSNVMGIIFEIFEKTFTPNLPNFYECWWDSLILDLLITNLGGIITAHFIMMKLGIRQFDYGIKIPFQDFKINNSPGNIKGFLHHCAMFKSMNHLLLFYLMIFTTEGQFLLSFYMKFSLKIEPSSPICLVGLFINTVMYFLSTKEIRKAIEEIEKGKKFNINNLVYTNYILISMISCLFLTLTCQRYPEKIPSSTLITFSSVFIFPCIIQLFAHKHSNI